MAFTEGRTRYEKNQEEEVSQQPGIEGRKMKLTLSNTLERASQDKDSRPSVPLKRVCSVKWG